MKSRRSLVSDQKKSSVKVLICSANLGNAQPDTPSINAWIPLNGQCDLALSRPPRFPVIMHPSKARNPPQNAGKQPSNDGLTLGTNCSQDGSTTEGESILQAKPEVTRRGSASSDYHKWLEQQTGTARRASFEDYASFLTKSQESSGAEKTVYENFLAEQSNSIDLAERSSRDEENVFRLDGSESSESSESDSFDNLVESRPVSSLDDFIGKDVEINADSSEMKRSLSKVSNASSIRFETNFPDALPPPPPMGSFDADGRRSIQPQESLEQFDIVVIGLQEATFGTENSSSKDTEETKEVIVVSGDEALSIEEVFEDLTMGNTESGSLDSFDFDADEATYQMSSKSFKKSAGKMLNVGLQGAKAGYKAGKAGYKASKKVGKVTVKTAITVNNLTTAKDHTSRSLPTAQQASAPLLDGGFPGWADTDVLHYRFEDQLPGYRRALSYQLGEMRLLIYYKPMAIDLNVLSVKNKPTGKGGLANKGGIVAEVSVNQSTRLSFLTAHLEAHEGEEKYATRCTSLLDILTGTKSSATTFKYDASVSSHFSFAMGDLNYRTRLAGVEPGSERHIRVCHSMADAKDWATLNKYDELGSALKKKECLAGFRTPYCNFDPTFKVSRQAGYEYNKKRSPSYTDRILFKTGDQLERALRPILYEPVEDCVTSDHKPIRGAFNIKLNDRLTWRQALPLTKRGTTRNLDNDEELPSGYPIDEAVDRETMHVFVSSLQCVINPDTYDKIRKMKKADLPNSYVSFVSTPPEAVQADSSKKSMWKKLGLGGSSKTRNYSSDSKMKKMLSTGFKSSAGFPSTSVIQDTMRPSWNQESLHFTVRTHLVNGDPIDLSGAILHVTLFDGKGMEPKVVGSFPLNLARLIAVSRNPKPVNPSCPPKRNPSNAAPPLRGGPPRNRSGRMMARGGGREQTIVPPSRQHSASQQQQRGGGRGPPDIRGGGRGEPLNRAQLRGGRNPRRSSSAARGEGFPGRGEPLLQSGPRDVPLKSPSTKSRRASLNGFEVPQGGAPPRSPIGEVEVGQGGEPIIPVRRQRRPSLGGGVTEGLLQSPIRGGGQPGLGAGLTEGAGAPHHGALRSPIGEGVAGPRDVPLKSPSPKSRRASLNGFEVPQRGAPPRSPIGEVVVGQGGAPNIISPVRGQRRSSLGGGVTGDVGIPSSPGRGRDRLPIGRSFSGSGSNAVRGPALGRVGHGRGSGRQPIQRTKSGSGWSYSKPSPALIAASEEGNYPTPVQKASKSLAKRDSAANATPKHTKQQPRQLNRRGSLKFLNSGPSTSLRNNVVGDALEEQAADEKLQELKIMSLRLDEALIEGGLEVARIKCNIDVWWMVEKIPTDEK